MITASQCLKRYGNPEKLENQLKNLIVWEVPLEIQTAFSHVRFTAVGTIGFPKKIYINKEFLPVLEKALSTLIKRNLQSEMKTWDGCFMIRKKVSNSSLSLHSWAIAIDINAQENGYKKKPKLSSKFVECFKLAGCEWGGDWTVKDGMHFQLAVFPK